MEPGVWIERGRADMGGQEGKDIVTLEKSGVVLLGASFKTLDEFAEGKWRLWRRNRLERIVVKRWRNEQRTFGRFE